MTVRQVASRTNEFMEADANCRASPNGVLLGQPFQGEDVSLSGTLKKEASRLSLMHGSVEWRLSSGPNFMGYDTMCITQSISKLAEMMAINILRSSSGWLRR